MTHKTAVNHQKMNLSNFSIIIARLSRTEKRDKGCHLEYMLMIALF